MLYANCCIRIYCELVENMCECGVFTTATNFVLQLFFPRIDWSWKKNYKKSFEGMRMLLSLCLSLSHWLWTTLLTKQKCLITVTLQQSETWLFLRIFRVTLAHNPPIKISNVAMACIIHIRCLNFHNSIVQQSPVYVFHTDNIGCVSQCADYRLTQIMWTVLS